MEPLRVFVLVHGAFGLLALLAGTTAVLAPKQPGLHPRAGKTFATLMACGLVAISVPIVAKQNVFMLGLGTVAAFALVDGWRALWRFRGTLAPEAQLVDRVLVAFTSVVALGLGSFGVWGLVGGGSALYGVCVAFAVLAGFLVRGAVRRWRELPTKKGWLGVHVGSMSGAFGAALTAAAIVNLGEWAGSWQWVLWVVPTAGSTVWGQREIRKRGLGR